MYQDKRKNYWPLAVGILLLVLVVGGLSLAAFSRSGKDISEEGAVAIEEAIRRCCSQCYVVEGVYPPTLAYMEENYGLKVNTKDYYITYSAFASNLPPTIIVTVKPSP